MHPSPPKKVEELADNGKVWQAKMRRLEAHGEEFKLALLCKINALRIFLTGNAKEYFDLWEADHHLANAKKTYEELLNKVKDHARRRKLDTTAKERMQQGGGPMDLRDVGGWRWADYSQDGVHAVGFKGKGKRKRGKGQGECNNCGSTGHFS